MAGAIGQRRDQQRVDLGMIALDLLGVARCLGGTVNGNQVLAPGPNHSGADRSLSIKLDNSAPDGFVVNSFAGDDPIACRDYVREKLGLPAFKPNGNHFRASAATAQGRSKSRGNIVATYGYTDSDGTLLYQVLRYEPKDFRQRRPDGNGGWIWKLEERRVLYRWPELLKYPDGSVFICEGEKDADRVAGLNLCATTVATGKWTEDCVKALAGRDVVILEDNDKTGRDRALEAAQALRDTAKTIRIVSLPDLPDKGDVSDWLDADPRRARDSEALQRICFEAPLWQPGPQTEEKQEEKQEEEQQSEQLPPLPFIKINDWDGKPVPQQDWVVKDRIPARQVTLFSGEGAAGKSTELLHLSAAHALDGRDWLGTLPEPGPAIFFDAEDEKNVMHRRLAAIAEHYQTSFAELARGGLHLLSFAGQDALLATASRSGKIEPTPLYGQMLQAAGDIKPKMIGFASSANIYAGSEIDRSQVQQFIGMLTRLAILANGAVVLISHPSLTGIATDTGLSGNTQWHNAVRARFYLKGVKAEAGEEPDSDLREIVFKKNNYGPLSENIVLRYQNGLFLPVAGTSSLEKAAAEQAAEQMFMTLLGRFTRQGRNVSEKPTAPNYAPAEFAREKEAKSGHLTKATLANAMRRLFAANKIHVEDYGRPSRPSSRIAEGAAK
jgi:RecA-family ATPase